MLYLPTAYLWSRAFCKGAGPLQFPKLELVAAAGIFLRQCTCLPVQAIAYLTLCDAHVPWERPTITTGDHPSGHLVHTYNSTEYIVQYCKQRSRHKKKAMHHGRSNVLYFLLAPRKSKISHRHHWVRRPTQFARVVSRIGPWRTFRTTQMSRASAGEQSPELASPVSSPGRG